MTQDLKDYVLVQREDVQNVIDMLQAEDDRKNHRSLCLGLPRLGLPLEEPSVLHVSLKKALAQDLSGMRLVAPPPQTDDELFKSPHDIVAIYKDGQLVAGEA
jgi:hypothetical protein